MKITFAALAALALSNPAAAQVNAAAGSASRSFTPIGSPAGVVMPRLAPLTSLSFTASLTPTLSAPSIAPALTPAIMASALVPVKAAAVTPEKRVAPVAALKPAALSAKASLLSAAATPDEKPGSYSGDAFYGRVFDGSKEMVRPLEESWVVDGKEYATTAELVKSLPPSDRPVKATYRFRTETASEPARPVANAAIGALAGGVIAAAATAVFMALMSALGGFLDVIFLQPGSSGLALSEILVGAGVIGGLGAIIGAGGLWSRKPAEAAARELTGMIWRSAGPGGEIAWFETAPYERPREAVLVDLGKHAGAALPGEAKLPAAWPAWKRALAGAGLGLALAAWYWTPLLMIGAFAAGPAAGAAVFGARLKGTGLAGSWLGGAIGLLLTIGAFASFGFANTVGILPTMLVWGGALTVVGTITGLWAANHYRADAALDAAREPKDQWWAGAGR